MNLKNVIPGTILETYIKNKEKSRKLHKQKWNKNEKSNENVIPEKKYLKKKGKKCPPPTPPKKSKRKTPLFFLESGCWEILLLLQSKKAENVFKRQSSEGFSSTTNCKTVTQHIDSATLAYICYYQIDPKQIWHFATHKKYLNTLKKNSW